MLSSKLQLILGVAGIAVTAAIGVAGVVVDGKKKIKYDDATINKLAATKAYYDAYYAKYGLPDSQGTK